MSLIKKHESSYIKKNTNGDRRFYSGPFGGDIQIFAGALKWEIWTFNQTEYINSYIEPPQRDMKFDKEAKRVQRWKIWPKGKNVWATSESKNNSGDDVEQNQKKRKTKEDLV